MHDVYDWGASRKRSRYIFILGLSSPTHRVIARPIGIEPKLRNQLVGFLRFPLHTRFCAENREGSFTVSGSAITNTRQTTDTFQS